MDKRPYNEVVQQYYASQMIQVPQDCNGYVAVNCGDTILWVNGFRLLPAPGPGLSGESKGAIGNKDEIYTGNNGQIQLTVDKVVGIAPFLQIVFKFYI
jgi:hypothetical protein